MSLRFYMNRTGKKKYLQIWKNKDCCVSLGTPDLLVKTIMDENKTKKLREKFTKLIKEDQ